MENQKGQPKRTTTFTDVLVFIILPFLYGFGLIFWIIDKLPCYNKPKAPTAIIHWQTGNVSESFTVKLNTDDKENTNIMLSVKATQPNANFSIEVTGAADSEGNPIPASNFSLSAPETDNTTAVAIENWNPETRQGELSFGRSNPDGTPNIANLTLNVLNLDGTVAAPLGEQIAVVAGDVATFEGGFVIDLEATPTPTTNADPTIVPVSSPEVPAAAEASSTFEADIASLPSDVDSVTTGEGEGGIA